MIAHVVNDQAARWGRAGFAGALGEAYDHVRFLYTTWLLDDPDNLRLGNVHFATLPDDIIVASMVAQAGYGPSREMRLRYEALEECLRSVSREAQETNSSVHMPRIGAGQAGGRWPVIREIIDRTLCRAGIAVTVYALPGEHLDENGDGITIPRIGLKGGSTTKSSGFLTQPPRPHERGRGSGQWP
jgi:hypothetical protein